MSCRIFPINYRKLWQVGIRLNPWLKYRRVIDAFTSIHVINSTLFSTILIAQFRVPNPSLALGRFVKRREEKVDMGKRENDEKERKTMNSWRFNTFDRIACTRLARYLR